MTVQSPSITRRKLVVSPLPLVTAAAGATSLTARGGALAASTAAIEAATPTLQASTKPVSMAVSTSRGTHYNPLWWCCGSQIASLPYILAGLAKQDAQRNVQPWLASSYEMSDDCATVTIKLHPEATWTDGKPLTADDLVWTWELWTAPWIFGKDSPQSVAWGLAGAKEFNEGTADTISGVTVVDEHTVTAKLDPPYCVWSINQYMEWGILPKHVFDGVAP